MSLFHYLKYMFTPKNRLTFGRSIVSNVQKKLIFCQFLKSCEKSFMFFEENTIYINMSLFRYLKYMFTPKNRLTLGRSVVSNVQKKLIFCQFLKKIAFFKEL